MSDVLVADVMLVLGSLVDTAATWLLLYVKLA
jgi:hypothetical protein